MGKNKLFVGILFVFAVAVSWYWGKSQSSADKADDEVVTAEHTETRPPETARRSFEKDRPKVDMRKLVQNVVQAEVPPLRTPRKVEAYLETLKERAKEKGHVTALEVQPGIEAIRSVTSELGEEETEIRIAAFANEMAAMSRQFGDVPDQPTPMTPRDARALLNEIALETDEDLKQQAVREYLDRAMMAEDPEQQGALTEDLRETLGLNKEPQEPPDLDKIAETITNAEDETSKQDAIRKYIEAIQVLEPEEQASAMKRLDELRE